MSVQTPITSFFGVRKRTIGDLDDTLAAKKKALVGKVTDDVKVGPQIASLIHKTTEIESPPTKKRKVTKESHVLVTGQGKHEVKNLEKHDKAENKPDRSDVNENVNNKVDETDSFKKEENNEKKTEKITVTTTKLEESITKPVEEKIKVRCESPPKIKPFDEIVLEVPTTPLQAALSPKPLKSTSATKHSASLLARAAASTSPLRFRRALFKSPVKEKASGDGFENQLASEILAEQKRRQFLSPKKVLETILAAGESKEAAPGGGGGGGTAASPAFERHYRLASAGVINLCLPRKYSALAEIFKAVDACVSIMYNRKESIMFDKLRSSVQRMIKRNLTETHLAQIMTVMVTAYSFERKTVRKFGAQGESSELFVKPNFDNKDAKGLSPVLLLERDKQFRENLLNRVHVEHEKFLKNLVPPLHIPKDKLTRWHPEFDVERLCPDIAPSDKFPPVPDKNKFSSARDVLNRARDVFGANARLEKALQKVAAANNNDPTQSTAGPPVILTPPPPSSATIPAIANALKGLPKSILEKVRARQAAKTVELLTRSSQETKKRIELTRLPEIVRMLRYQYILDRRNVLPMHTVLTRLVESYRETMTQEEMKRHLQLIEKSVPGWLVIINDDNKEYVKVAKDADLQKVMARLNDLIDKNPVSI